MTRRTAQARPSRLPPRSPTPRCVDICRPEPHGEDARSVKSRGRAEDPRHGCMTTSSRAGPWLQRRLVRGQVDEGTRPRTCPCASLTDVVGHLVDGTVAARISAVSSSGGPGRRTSHGSGTTSSRPRRPCCRPARSVLVVGDLALTSYLMPLVVSTSNRSRSGVNIAFLIVARAGRRARWSSRRGRRRASP